MTDTIVPGDTSGLVEQKGKPFADLAPAEREAFITQHDVDPLKTPLESVTAPTKAAVGCCASKFEASYNPRLAASYLTIPTNPGGGLILAAGEQAPFC